jgi:hypothetical protein
MGGCGLKRESWLRRKEFGRRLDYRFGLRLEDG